MLVGNAVYNRLRALIRGARFARLEEIALLELLEKVPSEGVSLTTGPGTGIPAANYDIQLVTHGKNVELYTWIDLTGLHSEATDLDIIGVDGNTDPAHFGLLAAADLGYIYDYEIHCLELPAGGDPNIAFYMADEGTGVEDSLITALTETVVYDKTTDWVLGDSVLKAGLDNMPVVGKYLYLAQGDAAGTDADYSAGQFLTIARSRLA